jgi:glycosyltransferase involved in cell wall biosynthesis
MLPFRPEPVTHGALPGKILQYLACGLPTIATPLNGLQSMIAPDQGVLYANGPQEMANLAVELASNVQHQNILSLRGIQLMNLRCSWKNQLQSFENMLLELRHG